MKPLTPEQQAFAEEHHGLLLDFMAKHSLGDDYYDLLANRYLKVVVRYLSEEALRKYSFSTLVWYHLRSELSNYARDQVGKPQEIPIEFYCEIPAPEIAPFDDEYSMIFRKDNAQAEKYIRRIQEIYQEFKNNHTPSAVNNVVQGESAIEKLKKLKEIYDLNIITEEEYEEKRNKLLQEI